MSLSVVKSFKGVDMSKTIFESSQEEQHAYSLPQGDPAFEKFNPPHEFLRETPLPFPGVSEIDLTRHFSKLAQKNMSIDTQFYPLGSCTMKLNPRIDEKIAALPKYVRTHPLAPDESVQGNLQMISELLDLLCQICGMQGGTLLPNAGAQGEFIGLRLIAAYHAERGEESQRKEILVPDSAHGTNPATAKMAGFRVKAIPSSPEGDIDIEALKKSVSPQTAGLMLTNPNTLGLFSTRIQEATKIVHDAGGLLYYDGANLNAILNLVRPGDMGFDAMHVNLHKTFSTPHGGGGPGSGPVLCKQHLIPFLPVPFVQKENTHYHTIWKSVKSIGHIASFHGNFSIYLRAYIYIKLHGNYGLRRISEQAILNANYLKNKLGMLFSVPFGQPCMHEFVMHADRFLAKKIKALDIAKRLLDYDIHPPTIYFPLTIKECMLIEPTESESKATLDHFVAVMAQIVEEIDRDPELVRTAPHKQCVSRLDETYAAKNPVLKAAF
jgi:glycine dehydrogenase subunit 2